MPSRNLIRAFVVLWWVVGVVLLVASIRTIQGALLPGHHDPHHLLLGGFEAVAAVVFLIPWTMRVGAIGLLLALVVALVVHAVTGPFAWTLLAYAAAVLYVAVHGAPPRSAWAALIPTRRPDPPA